MTQAPLHAGQLVLTVVEESSAAAFLEMVSQRMPELAFTSSEDQTVLPPGRIVSQVFGPRSKVRAFVLCRRSGEPMDDAELLLPMGDLKVRMILAITWPHGVSRWQDGGDLLNFLQDPPTHQDEAYYRGAVWFGLHAQDPQL